MFFGRIKKKMKVTVEVGHYYFKVFIENTLHVCIDRHEFVGISTWYDCETQCSIEWVTKTNSFKTEYDKVEKWKTIINAVNDNL